MINKKTVLNKARKSAIKTSEKRFLQALETGNLEEAELKLRNFEKKISKGASKGIYHSNAAARKISRLRKKLNAAAE